MKSALIRPSKYVSAIGAELKMSLLVTFFFILAIVNFVPLFFMIRFLDVACCSENYSPASGGGRWRRANLSVQTCTDHWQELADINIFLAWDILSATLLDRPFALLRHSSGVILFIVCQTTVYPPPPLQLLLFTMGYFGFAYR